jgi:hypothetical protein
MYFAIKTLGLLEWQYSCTPPERFRVQILVRILDILNEAIRSFTQFIQEIAKIVPPIKLRLHPSISFPIHYSLTITQIKLLKTSNKP